jgi:hypothetical protein
VKEAIVSAIREVDLRRNLAVQAVVDSLDAASFEVLMRCLEHGHYLHPERTTMGQALAAVSLEAAVQRLLTLGLLKVEYPGLSSGRTTTAMDAPLSTLMPYSITALGQSACDEIARRLSGQVA